MDDGRNVPLPDDEDADIDSLMRNNNNSARNISQQQSQSQLLTMNNDEFAALSALKHHSRDEIDGNVDNDNNDSDNDENILRGIGKTMGKPPRKRQKINNELR